MEQFVLFLDKEKIVVHKPNEEVYYIEDTTGIYEMSGKAKDYLDYMLNKGWELQ